MKFLLIAFALHIIFISCNNHKKDGGNVPSGVENSLQPYYYYNNAQLGTAVVAINLSTKEIGELEMKIVNHGDTSAYAKLSLYYDLNENKRPLLFYSQLMCNKYEFAMACYDCYDISRDEYAPDNFKANDSVTQSLGLFYLLKSYELGYRHALPDVQKHFNIETLPFSNEFGKKSLLFRK